MATAVEAAVAQGCLSYFVTAHVPGLVVIMTHVCEEGYPPPDATGGKGTECGLARGSSHGGLRGGELRFCTDWRAPMRGTQKCPLGSQLQVRESEHQEQNQNMHISKALGQHSYGWCTGSVPAG